MSLRNAPVAKRAKAHLETKVAVAYTEQMTSQLVSVAQRISQRRVAARGAAHDRGTVDTSGRATAPDAAAAYAALVAACAEDCALLQEVLGRAHAEVYLPLVALIREARAAASAAGGEEEAWVAMAERVREALWADLTAREAVAAELGPSLEEVLLVPKETMRAYVGALAAHPLLDAEGELMRRTIELANLCC